MVDIQLHVCADGAAGAVPGQQIKPWAQDKYMPRIDTVYGNDPKRLPFDFTDVLAIIAPRAVYIHAALDDSNFFVSSVRQCVATARRAVAASGHDPDAAIVASYPKGGHGFPQAARMAAYDFIAERFGRLRAAAL